MDGLLGLHGSEQGADRSAVARLAHRIVAEMAGGQRGEIGPPRPELTELLAAAARTGDPRLFQRLQSECRRLRVSAERVIDIYIPAAVGQLGAAWHNDEMNILQATVAFCRLQDLLRDLGTACLADYAGRTDGPRVLTVVPEREQHTIGGLLATNQMRRLGVSVAIEFSACPSGVLACLERQPFDAVFLSASNREAIVTCEHIIRSIRQSGHAGIAVAVGGTSVARYPDAVASIGADVVSQSVHEALMTCGLMVRSEAAQ